MFEELFPFKIFLYFVVDIFESFETTMLKYLAFGVSTNLFLLLPMLDMSLHWDTLSWFQANQSLLLLINAVCLAEKQQIPIL